VFANTRLCPYCGVRPRNSDDHVFPEFMGGKTTVRACKPCNDLFGHAFEGPVSNDFAPTVVMLRRGGLHSPRHVVWRRAVKRDGIDYDLDSDLQMTPSDPRIERDEQGSIKQAVFANRKAAGGFIRGLEAQGKKFEFTPQTITGIDMREVHFAVNIGPEVRRLALKIAIAAADYLGFGYGLVDSEATEFLLGRVQKSERVRIDLVIHESIEKMRPPLSHFVFVKGNSETHNIYAIVQFYGLVQFWVLLNEGGFTRDHFAIAAALDIAKGYEERFKQAELLLLPVPPVEMGYAEVHKLRLEWMEKWNTEARAVLQDDAKIASLDITKRV
jgi:hypothetical protein